MSLWTDFNTWCDTNPRLSATLFVVPFLILLLLCFYGCGTSVRGPLHPGAGAENVGLFAQLESIGGWFVYVGLLVAGLALVARLAGTFFVPVLAPFANVLGDITEIGLIAALVGGIFVWLSGHAWLVVLACVLAGLAWAWCRRARIRAWILRIKANAVKS